MDIAPKIAWIILALIHLFPALVFFRPELTRTLYEVSPSGQIGVLLIHRGALFLAVFIATLFAVISVESRKLASLFVGISIISFLIIYVRAGLPKGALRKIALTDVVALPFWGFVTWQAWSM